MTAAQKQLLGAVPVALLIVGAIAFKVIRFQKVLDNRDQLETQRIASGQMNTSMALFVLSEIEEHIKKLDAAVVKVEDLDLDLDADSKKAVGEATAKAVSAVEQRKQQILLLKRDTLPEPIRDRLTAAETKCDDLLERLNRIRPANNPPAQKK